MYLYTVYIYIYIWMNIYILYKWIEVFLVLHCDLKLLKPVKQEAWSQGEWSVATHRGCLTTWRHNNTTHTHTQTHTTEVGTQNAVCSPTRAKVLWLEHDYSSTINCLHSYPTFSHVCLFLFFSFCLPTQILQEKKNGASVSKQSQIL